MDTIIILPYLDIVYCNKLKDMKNLAKVQKNS